MNDDPQPRREDFDECFAGEPPSPSADGDVIRGRDLLRRRRRTAGGVVAGIVAIVVLAVPLLTSQTFAPAPIDPAVPTTVQPTAPTPGPTGSTAPAGTCTGPTIKIADAITDPKERPIADPKPVPDTGEDGKNILMLAVGPTGEVLLEEGRNDTSENDVSTLRPGRLTIWSPVTGKRTTVRGEDDLHQGTQTIHAVFDQDYVVWIETPDTSIGISNWKMYAFNRSTEKISEVAPSREDPGGLSPQPRPRLWNGSVYWEVGRDNPEQGAPKVVDVYTRTLDLREPPRRIIDNAVQPTPTDGWIYYERYDRGAAGYAVHRTSLDGDRTELVHQGDDEYPGDLAADGEYSAWTEGNDVVVYRGTALVARLVPPKGDQASGVTFGDGVIGFISGNGGSGEPEWNYLLDVRSGCSLYRLSDNDELAGVIASGRTVAWAGPQDNRYTWTVGRLR